MKDYCLINFDDLLNIDISGLQIPQEIINAFNALKTRIVLGSDVMKYLSWHRLDPDWTVKFINSKACLLEHQDDRYSKTHFKIEGNQIKDTW